MKNEYDEYEVLIEDLDLSEDNTEKMNRALKRTIRHTINARLRSKMMETRTPKGLEIDIPSEWRDILDKDSSILGDYEKIGWKIMWYNKHSLGPGRGDLIRSWLSFRSGTSVSKGR